MHVVAPEGVFASAVADLEALGPVASVPILALTPDASFGLAAVDVKGLSSQKRGARVFWLPQDCKAHEGPQAPVAAA
jgi:hypothetical protein